MSRNLAVSAKNSSGGQLKGFFGAKKARFPYILEELVPGEATTSVGSVAAVGSTGPIVSLSAKLKMSESSLSRTSLGTTTARLLRPSVSCSDDLVNLFKYRNLGKFYLEC
jgi:hypothetical protein